MKRAMMLRGCTPPDPEMPVRISAGVRTPIASNSRTAVGGTVTKSAGR